VSLGAATTMAAFGPAPLRTVLTLDVNWNVIGLFLGTLILAELFMQSRMPAVLAELALQRTRTAFGAMLSICALASVLSMFLENVAVVLLLAPVVITLCRRARVPPLRLLVLVAICSNLQGTATLIGDPPSMILAGEMKLSFNDFFVYRGRPSIFFVVQAGAVASLGVAAWLLRDYRVPVDRLPVEQPRWWLPSWLLLALVIGLMWTHRIDPEFRWMAGSWAMVLAMVGLIWYCVQPNRDRLRDLVRTLDWSTTLFLVGVFILVAGVGRSGWLEWIATRLSEWSGNSLVQAFVVLLTLSVVVSGFVDNIPFLAAMIPVARTMAGNLGGGDVLLPFTLLVGSCLGGNITPTGASANIVAIGLATREQGPVRFGEFVRLGLPFTVASVLSGGVVLWTLWGM
jgi:Na+/H+ antiporter NhaD/arsenite permease-like protein